MGKFIHGGLRSAQAHLNRKLAERDLGRNIRSSRQTVGQYLDHWLDICARPRLRAKSFCDYSSLLARYVRPRLGARPLGELSPAEIQTLYGELLNRKLSARTIRYTHAVLASALRQSVRWKLLLTNPAEDVHLPRQSRRAFTVFGRYFRPLLESAGLPNIRLYDLRHTAATLALVAGVSPKVVSEQLGHASAAFTLDVYSHVLPHMQDAAAMKVEALLMAA